MIPTGVLDFPEGRYQIRRPAANVGREAATVVMIFAVAWAATRSGWQTLTGFALVFGV